MKRPPFIIAILVRATSLVGCLLCASVMNSQESPKNYRQEIRPILDKHCFSCHGPDKQKGNLRLDTLDPGFDRPSAEKWHDALNKINLGEMPPEDRPEIDTPSRRILTDWIRTNLDRVSREQKGEVRQTVLRRLTRYEYNNTLCDLLGINSDFARDLPPESTSRDGFKNNGGDLGMSPLQIEYYLSAARLALDKAIVEGPAPKVFKHRFEKSSSGKARKNTPVAGNRMPPQGRFFGKMLEYPREGEFVIRVKAGGSVPEGQGFPRMRLTLGLRSDTQSPSRVLGEVDVRNSESDKQVYEFRGRMEEFPLPGHNPKFPGVTITVSNVYEDGIPVKKPAKPKRISLNAAQRKQVNSATKTNSPTLPVSKDRSKGNRAISNFAKAAARLQKQVEELRLLSPQDKNQDDLARRLNEINKGRSNELKLIKDIAKKQLQEDPEKFLRLYREKNAAQLADRQAVIDRFGSITPRDRNNTQLESTPMRTTLVIDYLEFEGPVFDSWPPKHHRNLLPTSTEPERKRAQAAIENFMARAYRRPIDESDVRPVLALYDQIRPASKNFEEAIRESLAMVLVSPGFLYLVEPVAETSGPLSQHELASRLSYFLWSSMPDTRLRELADTGRLNDPEVLANEVQRMIGDNRSQEFVNHFTNQWLDLGGLDRVAINPNYYPKFDDRLKPLMKQETQAFFGEILRKDLSALNLIDSEFAMLNEPLAKHYGISVETKRPKGWDFERVTLKPEHGRGGLLTQASFLMINSDGEDSHPIRRAVWLLDRLLDDPPAPPPPDVPELDSEQPDFAKLPLKQQLEIHRKKVACNDCHRNIDPWGIAFESFDAVGLRREKVLRKVGRKTVMGAVDDQSTLPNGARIDGVSGLKKYLLNHDRDRFARAIVSKLLVYALGRSLVFEDRATIEKLAQSFKNDDYRLSRLIVAIVRSDEFQNK